jgi:low temperature requirement protein LtrA
VPPLGHQNVDVELASAEPDLEPPEAEPVAGDRRTSAVEMLWDLVFVFAVTQVTTLLSNDLHWAGLGRSMLILALVWWAWSAFVWAANAQDPDSPVLRGALLLALLLIFIAGLAIPHAFVDHATLFATTYAGVRFVHLALYADASRRGNASWSAIAGFAVTVVAGMVLLIVGSFAHDPLRIVLWTVAAAIDYAGPAWLTRERLRGLQQVAVAHFAERYGLFVIICLGESIVAIGLGASGGRERITFELIATVALGLLITVGLWWVYFHRFAATAEERLREHDDPVLAAADSYSYLHLVLVAGIIIFAVGVRHAAQHVGGHLPDGYRLALCGGVALYLVGHAAFRLRIARILNYDPLIAAAAAMGVFAAGGGQPAWVVSCAVAVVLALLCAREAAVDHGTQSA